MCKYLLITTGYPSEQNLYSNAFVHVRAKEYIRAGLDVDVFFVNRRKFAGKVSDVEYAFEGVSVTKGNLAQLKTFIQERKYKKILVHFAYKTVLSTVLSVSHETPIIVWSHGADVISWRRRLFGLSLKTFPRFCAYAILNVYQRIYLHNIKKRHSDIISNVFVSSWLKDIAEKDLWLKGKMKNCYVIPNPINTEAFIFRQKKLEQRLYFLTIRSFANRKYANEYITKAILKLSQKPFFDELNFMICGKGKLWKNTIYPIEHFENVILQNRYFTHDEIKVLHDKYGVMLMPSLMDTHGISTCEGMSSGLVAISSDNSAIPEYVPGSCAYLTKSIDEIVQAIEDIYYTPEKYLAFSKAGADFIRAKCGTDIVIKAELEVIKG